jgi:hypothetical protein
MEKVQQQSQMEWIYSNFDSWRIQDLENPKDKDGGLLVFCHECTKQSFCRRVMNVNMVFLVLNICNINHPIFMLPR